MHHLLRLGLGWWEHLSQLSFDLQVPEQRESSALCFLTFPVLLAYLGGQSKRHLVSPFLGFRLKEVREANLAHLDFRR